MLVVVMVKFCVCHTMPTVVDLCEMLVSGDWWQTNAHFMDLVISSSNLLVVFNSSCNFFIYLVWAAR